MIFFKRWYFIMSKGIKRVNIENGFYLFKLEQLLDDRKISKNKLVRDTNTDFKVIQRVCKGDIVRIDITVLARLCDYLECDMTDIIEYKR